MLARQMVTVVVRLFALCLLLWAMRDGLNLHLRSWQADTLLIATIWITTVAVPAALALMLWRFPQVLLVGTPRLAERKSKETTISAEQLQAVGISLIGFWLLATGLSELFVSIGILMHFRDANPSAALASVGGIQIISPIVQTCLSIAMIFGARGIGGLLRPVRAFGN